MNIARSFADYLSTITSSTLGQDLFIGEAPSSNKVPDAIFWIVSSGGTPTKNITGESIKEYSISVYYRSRNYGLVYDMMQELEDTLNCDDCTQLEGYETIDIQAAVLSIDEDLDNEDRKVGLLQVNINVYKNCLVV